ncbi:hypothetical protein AVEN_7605-1, partial [Araneus ventricosus]
AFADDFAFVISHKTKDGVQQLANRAITTFSNWAELNKLQISLEKTKYIYLGNLINPARIKWNNTRIQKVSTLRYLGIIIDDKLKWIPHIKEKGTKALQQYQHFQRIAGKNWGLTTANRKLIYKTVIERMLCHGAVAWAQKITESMKRKLNTIQRKFLLLITKAYYTKAYHVQCNPLSSDSLDSTGTLSSAPAATPFTNTRHSESSSLAAAVSDTVHPRANAIEESLGVSSAVRAGKLVS